MAKTQTRTKPAVPVTLMKIQKCCLCEVDIEQHRTESGQVYWSMGNNASPLGEGRCCDTCNTTLVIPARVRELSGYPARLLGDQGQGGLAWQRQ